VGETGRGGGWGGLGKLVISPITVEWDKHQKQNRG
jgi:hypothetical protein